MIKRQSLLLLLIILVLLPFWSLITNIRTNLVDWRDYAFIVWIMNQNVENIKALDFLNFFNTNAFYPHPYTKLLSEVALPQSIIMFPFVNMTNNIILSFNITFLTTIVLNAFTAYLLWKKIFKNSLTGFVGSILSTFSPFFYTQYGHFTMITYWPFYLCLFFLLQVKDRNREVLFVALTLSIQFLANAYLGIFLLFSVCVYFILEVLHSKNPKPLRHLTLIFGIFLLLDGIFIYGYLNASKYFDIRRPYTEYVTYSAHLGDYLFTTSINSPIHTTALFNKWNSFRNGRFGEFSSFPGFGLIVLSIFALIKFKSGKLLSLMLQFNKKEVFFVLLIITGFVFSLGPRLQFNGSYDRIPLPYHFIVKFVPLIDSVRVPARWSFIFFLGLTYFALKGFAKIKSKVALVAVVGLIILEYIPLTIHNEKSDYIFPQDIALKSLCKNNPLVILEIPVTHFDASGGIVNGLSYIARRELASSFHKCKIVNGYSGFDLPSIQNIKEGVYDSINENEPQLFYDTVRHAQAEVIVINYEYILDELKPNLPIVLSNLEKLKKIEAVSENIYEVK